MNLHEKLLGVIKDFFRSNCLPIMCERCDCGDIKFPACVCELLASHLEKTVYEDYKGLQELLDAAVAAQISLQHMLSELQREVDNEQN